MGGHAARTAWRCEAAAAVVAAAATAGGTGGDVRP